MAVRKHIKEKHGGTTPALQRYEILRAIKDCDNPRDSALIATLYLTGCRIEELVRYKHYDKNVSGQAIKKEQIEIADTRITIRNVRTLKLTKLTRVNGEKVKQHRGEHRSIPILLNQLDKPFIDIFLQHITPLEANAPLFNISRVMAYLILSKVGIYPHLLRHARLTHLSQDYNFKESDLRQFTGWSTSNTAKHYVHLNVTDLFEKMERYY